MPFLFEDNRPLTRDNFTARWNYQAFLYGAAMDIGGGVITKEEIDEIQNYPQLTRISIAGLHQDTFDYFVERYGGQFKAICFFKNKMVQDLSALEKLDGLEVLTYFLNQRATALWDMSKNTSLKMLNLDDFSRLKNLSGVEKAPVLECLEFGNAVWATSEIDVIPDLSMSALEEVSFNATLSYESIYEFLKMPNLQTLNFRSNLCKTEFLAWISVNYPHLEGNSIRPYYLFDDNTGFICGKRKPHIDMSNEKDVIKVERCAVKFEKMKEKYRGWTFDEIMQEL